MSNITVSTNKKREVIDITERINAELPDEDGIAVVFVHHTTAALSAADLDPGTDQDLLNGLAGMLPDKDWQHPHDPDHAPDHLLSSIIGPSVSVPYVGGQLQLGTWQRIILLEFDGPRKRKISISI